MMMTMINRNRTLMGAGTGLRRNGDLTGGLLKHELTATGVVLGRNSGVRVRFEGAEARTDGKNVTLPAFVESGMIARRVADVMRGYLDHEAGHVKHTCFATVVEFSERWRQAYGDALAKKFHELANALEDMDFEPLVMAEYPGAKAHLRAVAQQVTGQFLDQIAQFKAENGGQLPDILLDKTEMGAVGATWLGRADYGGAAQMTAFDLLGDEVKAAVIEVIGKLRGRSVAASKAGRTRQVMQLAESTMRQWLGNLPTPEEIESQKGKGSGEGQGEGQGENQQEQGENQQGGSQAQGQGGERDESTEGQSDDGGAEQGSQQGQGEGQQEEGEGQGDGQGQEGEGEGEGQEGEGESGQGSQQGSQQGSGQDQGQEQEQEGEGPAMKKQYIGKGQGGSFSKPSADVAQIVNHVLAAENVQSGEYDEPAAWADRVHHRTGMVGNRFARASNYRVRVESDNIVNILKRGDQQMYDYYKSQIGDSANTLRGKLRKVLLSQKRRGWKGFREEGKLDSRRLVAAVRGETTVYKVPSLKTAVNTALCVMVDLSGSMTNSGKDAMAAKTVIAIAEALEGTQVSLEVRGFSNRRVARSEDRERTNAGISGPCRLEPLDTVIFKKFDEPLVQARAALGTLPCLTSGYNSDGAFINQTVGLLMDRPEPRKVILTLSDGNPNCGSGHGEQGHLHDAIKAARALGVECYGVGIRSHAVQTYYGEDSPVVRDVDDLANTALDSLWSALLGGNSNVRGGQRAA